jgi:hypothetical protein
MYKQDDDLFGDEELNKFLQDDDDGDDYVDPGAKEGKPDGGVSDVDENTSFGKRFKKVYGQMQDFKRDTEEPSKGIPRSLQQS